MPRRLLIILALAALLALTGCQTQQHAEMTATEYRHFSGLCADVVIIDHDLARTLTPAERSADRHDRQVSVRLYNELAASRDLDPDQFKAADLPARLDGTTPSRCGSPL